MHRPSLVAVAVLVVGLGMLGVTPAQAATYTATDRTGDVIYPGADIKTVGIDVNGNGSLTVAVGTDYLIGGNRLGFYFDTDLNARTGWLGADVAIFYEEHIQGNAAYAGYWNGTSWTFFTPPSLTYTAGNFGVAFNLSVADLGNPQVVDMFLTGFHAVGIQQPDFAPDSGSWRVDLRGTAVGGVSGPGVDDPAPAPADSGVGSVPSGGTNAGTNPGIGPVAASAPNRAKAKSATRALIRKELGRRAVIKVRSCSVDNAATRICKVKAHRGKTALK